MANDCACALLAEYYTVNECIVQCTGCGQNSGWVINSSLCQSRRVALPPPFCPRRFFLPRRAAADAADNGPIWSVRHRCGLRFTFLPFIVVRQSLAIYYSYSQLFL